MTFVPTTFERPVLRDPKTGLLGQHSAYEGWKPKPSPKLTPHGLGFVLMGAALAAAIVAGVGL